MQEPELQVLRKGFAKVLSLAEILELYFAEINSQVLFLLVCESDS